MKIFMKMYKTLLKIQSERLNKKGDNEWRSGSIASAEEYFRSAILKNRRYGQAYSNLGSVLIEQHRYDEGMAALEHAALLAPHHPGVLVNLGNAYYRSGHIEKATERYLAALEVNPSNIPALTNVQRALMDCCRWDEVERYIGLILNRARAGDVSAFYTISPFNSFFLPLTRAEQLKIAQHSANHWTSSAKGHPVYANAQRKPKSDRIRIGYLSSDFHDHATAHLSLRMYGLHNRSRFEVFAYSMGYPDNSPYRKKIEQECDKFVDVSKLDSDEIADLIALDQIDILVDLKGYTGGSRPAVMALRPAPIQVNYLGYPGTMGAGFIDYMIADSTVIPEDHEEDYAESIIRLPNSYQITDNFQAVDNEELSKSDLGLPDDKFIFCSFNVAAKIDRRTFSAWLKILAAVPDSVLWLLKLSDEAEKRLSAVAEAVGISPKRLIFALPKPKPMHLARLRHADLLLDTFTCNAHTTATDALWAGVPIVTLVGQTFASRVAASLANAAGLSALVTDTEEGYCQLAVDLARDKDKLSRFKDALKEKSKLPLFQTEQYVSNLEDAYLEMVQRC